MANESCVPAASIRGKATDERRRFIQSGIAAAVSTLVHLPARGDSFAPNETLVSATVDLIDLEYSQSRAMYARVDNMGRLWVGDIDRATGNFVQLDGKQYLADTDTMTLDDLVWVNNGPEWIRTPDGDQVVYTKILRGKRHNITSARIGLALPAPNGQWSGGLQGPDLSRFDVFGTSTEGGIAPAVVYLDDQRRTRWRDLYGTVEELVPGTTSGSSTLPRFVVGARAIVYRQEVAGVWQAFRYDLDTKALVQLTFDAGDKQILWMWPAPEFGHDYVLVAVVGSRELRVYRNLPTGSGGAQQWTVIYRATGPRGARISSLEPFTYNGRSYLFTVMKTIYDYPHEVWFSNIDSASRIWRCISNSTPFERNDPEFFITDHGPIIYFNMFDPAVPKQQGSLGLWRSDPGVS